MGEEIWEESERWPKQEEKLEAAESGKEKEGLS